MVRQEAEDDHRAVLGSLQALTLYRLPTVHTSSPGPYLKRTHRNKEEQERVRGERRTISADVYIKALRQWLDQI